MNFGHSTAGFLRVSHVLGTLVGIWNCATRIEFHVEGYRGGGTVMSEFKIEALTIFSLA
jgi:hypothetical protein